MKNVRWRVHPLLFVAAFAGSTVFAAQPTSIWVRHAPSVNGTVQGSIQVMTAESVTLNGGAAITGDLLVPGTPAITINGNASGFGGTIVGTGSSSPTTHRITLNGNVQLGHLRTRTDPVTLPSVATPPSPSGTRNVVLNTAGQSAGDFVTLRNLTLNGNVGQVAVPAGTYGDFTANGNSGFILGVAGATAPAVYHLQHLTLNGNTQLQVLGPIVLNVAQGFAANGSLGSSQAPERLVLNIAAGNLTLNSGALYGYVTAPNSDVILNGNCQLIGGLVCDDLTINGNGLLRFVPQNIPPTVALTTPASGAVFTAPATITLQANASDADGTVTRVEYFNGSTKLGETTAVPHRFAWANVVPGNYTLTAAATDNSGAKTTSAAVAIVVNAPPVVALTAPAANAVTVAPANLTLQATASDPDGSIAKVEFYRGATKLGESSTAPYQFAWTNVLAGSYSLTAVATDNRGAPVTSAAVLLVIDARPTVTLTAPTAGTTFTAPAAMLLQASAADTDGTVAKVEFFNGATKLGQATSAPFQFAWSNVAAGSYTVSAVATDNLGFATTSAAVTIQVVAPNVLPTVALTAPSSGATFNAPASVGLSATASDTDGTVTKVEFFQGSTKVGEAAAPFQFTWSNMAAGSYTLTAVATDNSGGKTTSAPVTITVNNSALPPTVALTAPVQGAVFTELASFVATAAVDGGGAAITKVEFFNNGLKVGEATEASYAAGLVNLPVGNYTLTAKATNVAGLSATSAPISVRVDPYNLPPTVTLQAPANGAKIVAGAPITLSATATDADGSIAKVEFYQGTTKLGESSVTPYQFTWGGAAPGSYDLVARAYDNRGAVMDSPTVSVTIFSPPVVALASPAAGSQGAAPATINLMADASSGSSTISRVEFYVGRARLTEVTEVPYNFTWEFVPAGTYAVKARAYDATGAFTDSAIVNVTVSTLPSGQSPISVALSSPQTGVELTAPATILLNAVAGDAAGTVSKVEFYEGATKLGAATTAPFQFTWTNVAAGTHAVTAKGFDAQGATGTSAPLTLQVLAPRPPPTIALSLSAATLSTGASVTLNGAAAATDNSTITRVEFYHGGLLLGGTATPPFQFSWTPAVAGTYTLTARAYASNGSYTDSAPITLQVTGNVAPLVSLATPDTGVTFAAGATIALQATGRDLDGRITKFDFYVNGAVVGSRTFGQFGDTTTPSGINYTLPASGPVTAFVRAFDDAGATADSAQVAFTVLGTTPPSVSLTTASLDNGAAQLQAMASAATGAIAKVEFRLDGVKVGEVASTPYALTLANPPAGAHTVRAWAYDSVGGITASAPVALQGNASFPFVADFEPAEGYVLGSLHGQKGWTVADGPAEVKLADSFSGAQAAIVQPSSGPTKLSQTFSSNPDNPIVFVDFYAKPAAEGQATLFRTESAIISLTEASGQAELRVLDGEGESAEWKLTGYKIALDADHRAKNWLRLTIREDFRTHEWDLYVNGRMIRARIAASDSSVDRFLRFAVTGTFTQLSRLDYLYAGYDNPLFVDADRDGMDDAWERAHGLDPTVDDRNGDPDRDRVPNIQEYVAGTDPQATPPPPDPPDEDADGDGLPNGWELANGLNPHDPTDAGLDFDGDGLTNRQEYFLGTDPKKKVSFVGIPDGQNDDDGDGVSTLDELRRGTDPYDYYNGVPPTVTPLEDYTLGLGTNGEFAVRVTDHTGRLLAGAPVFFQASPDTLLTTNAYGRGKATEMAVNTDRDGIAKVYVRPAN